MPEIIKVYVETMPKTRFIGKRYFAEDRINGSFSAKWDEWFEHGWFNVLEATYQGDLKDFFVEADCYVGLMRVKPDARFEYWIGMFLPEDTIVPEGFSSVDFPESKLGVAWVKGEIPAIYCMEEECLKKIRENGMDALPNELDELWFFERYNCPRFTEPDEKGEVILDICFFVK
ncbi:MAG: GyrI-like domain-containing protein [Bacilli bacterium]|nr:GyrI-like domain-containing protein [Bacilli bacterium]